MGYNLGRGEYSPSRPWENFLIPHDALKEENGRLKLKLTEPMEEVTYLDQVRLWAYDLPPGWQLALDERMGISDPQPTGKPMFYQRCMVPAKVTNDRGQNVTSFLRHHDLKAAPPGDLDRRFIGRLASDHQIHLTFDKSLDSLSGQPVLLAEGWVEYPYSQTNFAAWQAGADFRAPTLEARLPSGKWVVVAEQFGYPAGMPRQMALPLRGLPKGVTQIRITTNQEIYWDRIQVAFVQKAPESITAKELVLKTAVLEQPGFPKRKTLVQRIPHYDFNQRAPLWDTRIQAGHYTALGPCNELVEDRDGALAIFGPGEGIHLEFENIPAQTGYQRVYVLMTRGWCKDMDPYTHKGRTLEPLPPQGDSRARRLNQKYNHRYQAYE